MKPQKHFLFDSEFESETQTSKTKAINKNRLQWQNLICNRQAPRAQPCPAESRPRHNQRLLPIFKV
jgi:hypothetical protein